MSACLQSAKILLPKEGIDMKKWSVVACDQYTSQPDYWDEVERIVGEDPSTLRVTYPEIYLGETYDRKTVIRNYMKEYMEDILVPAIEDGYVLVERITESGHRLGLVGKVDLESYDFHPEVKSLIRPTEKTVPERIPPRIGIRETAIIELPHIMLLVDDPEGQIIEALYNKKDSLRKVYDTDLMMGGGHIIGYAIEGDEKVALDNLLEKLETESNGLFLVTGDGNHSLATAKVHWENLKKSLTPEELENHPARYALAEVVNLHSEALIFEPIHRLLMGVGEEDIEVAFEEYLSGLGIQVVEGDDLIFIQGGTEIAIGFPEDNQRLPVDLLQEFLDAYVEKHPEMIIDYIHGEATTKELAAEPGNCGMLVSEFYKSQMFDAIEAGGVLPRKTFSVGNAHEKRYYMESRVIVKI